MMAQYPAGKRKSFSHKPKESQKVHGENPNCYILRMLLSASPHYVSGSLLAQRLKISRVGVWSRIDKLRKEGLTIEASQNLGYRIAGEPNKIIQPLLEAWLSQSGKHCDLHIYDAVDSTNLVAERLLTEGEKTPFAVLADKQTNGKGRMGRKWLSPKGGNLYLSIAFRPDEEILKLRSFTLWEGIQIAQCLRDMTQVNEISVKWPNDIQYKSFKIGGMLTEASIDCERIRTLIFGLGLNINAPQDSFTDSLKKSSTSLMKFVPEKMKLHEVAANIIKTSLESFDQCTSENIEKKLLSSWSNYDSLFERDIKLSIGMQTIYGKAMGIDRSGGLRIKLKNGRLKIVHAGEISILK